MTEEEADKFKSAIDALKAKKQTLKKQTLKKQMLKIQTLKIQTGKIELDRALDNVENIQTALDDAEERGKDSTKEQESLNAAKKAEDVARKALSGANDALNALKKGGGMN